MACWEATYLHAGSINSGKASLQHCLFLRIWHGCQYLWPLVPLPHCQAVLCIHQLGQLQCSNRAASGA